ncbi:hypothetical protein [Puia sp.]|jgi:hypothetical protein|uniref:hypothetical protein n=1 Tax=Puia sp. TaxID=2045100 RepID=UPI002F3FB83F
MDQPEKLALKARLKKWAADHLGQRIATTHEAIRAAQEAANSEEKSSAGDKYETGRAMGHLQKDMHARQLAEQVRELATLHAVNTDQLCREGMSGALLRTASIDFFISIGLGKQTIEGRTIVFLSPQAPLARTLQNKRAGDSIFFQQETMPIDEIF